MFEKIVSIFKNYAIVKFSNNISSDILNYNVIFEDNNRKILGKIEEIIDNNTKISFLGEFINNRYYNGIVKCPTVNANIRIINKDELNELFGYNEVKSIVLGLSPIYGNYPVKVCIDNLFGSHTAFFGSTGSGKTYGIIRIIQNLFNIQGNIPLNAHFIIFNNSLEYYYSLKNINSIDKRLNYKLYSNCVNFPDSSMIKIPLWLMDINDYIDLLDINNHIQIDIIKKMLNIVAIIAKDDDNSNRYKNHIIASAINAILNSNQINTKIREKIFDILNDCSTNEINLNADVPAIGYTKNFSKCFDLDSHGEFVEKILISKYIRSFIDNSIVFGGDYTSTFFTLEQLETALNLALISDKYFLDENIYNASNELKYKLHSINVDSSKKIFSFEKYITLDKFIDSIFNINNNKVQIVNYLFDNISDNLSKKIIKIFCNIIYTFSKNNNISPINIIVEDADRYIDESDIFNKIIKNGENTGIIMNFVTNDVSKLPKYIISNCSNYFIFNLSDKNNLENINNILSNFDFNNYPSGNCLVFGKLVKTPTILKLPLPNPTPKDDKRSIYDNWFSNNK